jgi:hypothetical protein
VCGIHRASIDTPIDAPIDRYTDRSLFLSNLASSVDRFSRLDRSVGRRAIDVSRSTSRSRRTSARGWIKIAIGASIDARTSG